MNIKQAKTIPIQNLLTASWYKPAKAIRTDIWFLSPFRDEKTPSFKVNTEMNTRYDFGSNSWWDIIKLVQNLKGVNVSGALSILDSGRISITPFPAQLTVAVGNKKKWSTLIKTTPIVYFPLKQYLEERKIHSSIYTRFLVQVHYQTHKWTKFIALGFKNDAGDYEIRSKIFKGLLGKRKAITSINVETASKIIVFEWFFDLLAFCSNYRHTKLKQWFIVLNSINGKREAISLINTLNLNEVQLYLDNDSAGKTVCDLMFRELKNVHVEDCSHIYSGFKDYAEYWQTKVTKGS